MPPRPRPQEGGSQFAQQHRQPTVTLQFGMPCAQSSLTGCMERWYSQHWHGQGEVCCRLVPYALHGYRRCAACNLSL
eukprot:357634-Chlamydomonas_euryale.AAC.7